MSDNHVVFLGLDGNEARAIETIDAQIGWLIGRGVITPYDLSDTTHPVYADGPAADDLLDPAYLGAIRTGKYAAPHGFQLQAWRGWHIADPGGNFEQPPCPHCGVPYAAEPDITDFIIEWHDTRAEPAVTCGLCGKAAPVGDWKHHFFAYATNASLSFVGWWPFADEFRDELLDRIGHRARIIHARY